MPKPVPCPTADDLKRFHLGDLPEAAGEAVQLHLTNCRTCLAALQGLRPRDPLVESLRAQRTPTTTEDDDAQVNGLIARLMDCPLLSGAREARPVGPPPIDVTKLLAPAKRPDEIGRLGPYRVLKALGEGGMGMVLLAEDPSLLRPVALKVMRPEMAAEATARQRFLREARAMAAVKSDHVVVVHLVGEDRGVPFLAMELLEGETVEQRLERVGRLPADEVRRLGREVAEGLAAAHERGLIHRDIKPSNLWLERGTNRVKILDFGLAWLGDSKRLTGKGYIIGTPAYMSPEQAQGTTTDARSDLFSLGSVLYHAASGKMPFDGADTWATLTAVAFKEPRPLREVNPDIPDSLVGLITRLLAKRPEDRPSSSRAVAAALASPEPAPARLRSRRALAVAGLLLVAVLGGVIGLALTGRDRKPTSSGPVTEGDTGKGGPDLPPPIEKLLPDRARPFVAVAANGWGRQEFASFKPALDALETGGALEVYGNGPFTLGRVALARGKGLTLRAAPGYRPRFQLDPLAPLLTYWFWLPDGPLMLEGCDFFIRANDFVRGEGDTWQVRNCRLLGPECGQFFRFDGRRFHLRDCLIDGMGRVVTAGPKTEVELVNNLVRTHGLLGLLPAGGQSVRLEGNTLLFKRLIELPEVKGMQPITVTASGNLFRVSYGEGMVGWADGWKGRFHWKGQANLYSGRGAARVTDAKASKDYVNGLAEWRQFWGGEAGSLEAADVFFGWDQTQLGSSEEMVRALRLTTDWTARWTGKNRLGPDWDLVGAGEPYVNALKTDPRRTGAQGLPFALLHRGKSPTGYLTLVQALAQAVSGDTIEVGGAGPFAGCNVPGSGRALTLRAAPGSRPVLDGGLVSGDAWTIEGIHFRKGGVGVPVRVNAPLATLARLANCSFEQPSPGTTDVLAATFAASDGRAAEVVNCLVPAGLRARLPAGGKLVVRNSVLGRLSLDQPAGATAELELTGCLLHNLISTAPLLHVTGSAKVAVTAKRTLFEGLQHSLVTDHARCLARWAGQGNVYRFGGRAWANALGTPRAGFADWQRLWKDTEQGAAEAPPLAHEAFEWRLHPSSPGRGAGPGGKDLGADVARVARSTATPK